MTNELPTTFDEVRIKLSHVLTDLTIEMLDAPRSKMLKLHHLGVELEAVSFKLKCYKQLGMTSFEPLAVISDELDYIFLRMIPEEIITRIKLAS